MNHKPEILLALDPGDTTGVAAWDLSGAYYENLDPEILTLVSRGVARDMIDSRSTNPSLIPDLLLHIPKERMDDFLLWVTDNWNVRHIVVEDFVLFKRKAVQQSGSRMVASQIIGKAELTAASVGATFKKYSSDKLPNASKHAGLNYDRMRSMDHKNTHKYCAYVYGMEYMIENKMMPSALRLDKKYNG